MLWLYSRLGPFIVKAFVFWTVQGTKDRPFLSFEGYLWTHSDEFWSSVSQCKSQHRQWILMLAPLLAAGNIHGWCGAQRHPKESWTNMIDLLQHLSTWRLYLSERLELNPGLCTLNLHQISTRTCHELKPADWPLSGGNKQEFMERRTSKGHFQTCEQCTHMHMHVHSHKVCIWCWQIQWLIWACWSVKSHLFRRGKLLWSGSWLWIPEAAPNAVSQPLLSSMLERGRTAEQISLCFSTLVKAAPANTHQHSGTWRQLTPFSLLRAEQLVLGKICFVGVYLCTIREQTVIKGDKFR